MSKFLAETKTFVDEVRKQGNEIKGEEVEALKERYKRIIMKGIKENTPPLISESKKGNRGRPRQSKAKNLLDRFVKFERAVVRAEASFDRDSVPDPHRPCARCAPG